MDIATLEQFLSSYVEQSPDNHVRASYALDQSFVGTQLFERPLVRVADAHDPLFLRIHNEKHILGPEFKLPEQWLPEAFRVISICFPLSGAVVQSNAETPLERPSDLWLHARIEGQRFIEATTRALAHWIKDEGYEATIPSQSPSFTVKKKDTYTLGEPLYMSSWSERHVAFVAGMGTFDLTAHLITPAGKAMRLASIVTTAPLDVTPRPYGDDPFAYCTHCGACIARCPQNAITPAGKDVEKCSAFLDQSKELYYPRYGCGKCQVGLPCTFGIPRR
ncbi:MAG: 4Fe-4S binding protein [Atopobiaceae bacterium]|jgi:epoxyqueuosine reductase